MELVYTYVDKPTPTYWVLRDFMQLDSVLDRGIDDTRAAYVRSTVGTNILLQYIDTRCYQLQMGKVVTLTAYIKLIRRSTNQPEICVQKRFNLCSEIGIGIEGSNIEFPVAQASPAVNEDGYQLAVGSIQLATVLNPNDKVFFYVKSDKNYEMLVDNVSMVVSP
jgi:hypothetical protein